jgi:hypothetical protein
MPTLGSHFNGDEARELQEIAAKSPQKRVGPWIREAVNQRLEREGYLPGSPAYDLRVEALRAAEIAGPDAVLRALRSLNSSANTAT